MSKRPFTRPPIDRMIQIFQTISGGGFPGREQLAAEIEVTVKTIQRDIDFMRDRMNVPIVYVRERHGYGFSAPVSTFPFVDLTEGEIVSVFVAQKALTAHRGTPFEQPLRSAYAKLISSMNGRISVPWADLASSISFRTYQSSDVELAAFEIIGSAVRKSQILKFEYKKLGATRYAGRHVEPYHLVSIQGQWYLVAFDRNRDDWRNFVLSRMRNVEMSGELFIRDRPFEIDNYLKASLGVFQGQGNHTIRLEFDAWAAQLIRERTWHPAQAIHELLDGRLEFSIQLSSFEEIEPWILSWGDHVRVLEPAALQKQLRRTILQMAANFGAKVEASASRSPDPPITQETSQPL